MIIFLLNKLRHECRKGAIMVSKFYLDSIKSKMESVLKNLKEEVNSFGNYTDITKYMGNKPYIAKEKDDRVGCMSLIRKPVASRTSFRPNISESFIEGFNDFMNDVCEILEKKEYNSKSKNKDTEYGKFVKLYKSIVRLYNEKYNNIPIYSPTYIPGEDEYDDDVDYYKGAEFGSRRLLKEINKITG